MNSVYALFVACVSFGALWCKERPIVIVIPSYNNIKFYKKNLDSVRMQNYSNYHIVYIDDCSTDGTADAVLAYIHEWHLEQKISLIRNSVRRGAMYNHYSAAHICPDHFIIATLDGDDWFPEENLSVLQYLNSAYAQDIWMTYGQFQEYPSGKKGFCQEIPLGIKRMRAYRDYTWVTSHMRTYYAGLFKQIPIGYFIRNGTFLQSACDLAIMFALLERSDGRVAFIDTTLYMYNTTNLNSDCYAKCFEQLHNDYWIRSRASLTASDSYIRTTIHTPAVYNVHMSSDSTQCAAYCATIREAGLTYDQIHIFYEAMNDFEAATYQTLCNMYGIHATRIEPTTGVKAALSSYLHSIPAQSFTLVTTDGCTWQGSLNTQDVMDMLVQTQALCYSCTRGTQTHRDLLMIDDDTQPPFVHVKHNFFVWKPSEARGDAQHPYMAGAFIVRTCLLFNYIAHLRADTIPQLCSTIAQLGITHEDDTVLCTNAAPCCFNPDNEWLDQYHHNKNRAA